MTLLQGFKDLANNFVTNTFSEFTQLYTFESLVETPDGQGGFTKEWEVFTAITGFVKNHSDGNEAILDDHIKSEYMKKFSFEYVGGIDNDMRIIYAGDTYNIKSIDSVQDSTVWVNVIAVKDVAV